jgi:surface antigen
MVGKRAATALVVVSILSGCVSGGQGDQAGSLDKQTIGTVLGGVLGAVAGSQFGGGKGQLAAVAVGALAGAYLGNQIGASLDKADRAAIERKSAEALATARDGQAVRWKNPDSGTSAVITPRDTHSEERKVALLREKRVAPVPRLELIGESWEAKTAANIRSAPSTSANVVSGLKAGEVFTAVGKVPGSDWIAVGRGNRTVGYVAAALVGKPSAPATAPEAPPLRQAINLDALEKDRAVDLDAGNLVAEEVAAMATCRDMDVTVTPKDGKTEQQKLKACKGVDGAWEIL